MIFKIRYVSKLTCNQHLTLTKAPLCGMLRNLQRTWYFHLVIPLDLWVCPRRHAFRFEFTF